MPIKSLTVLFLFVLSLRFVHAQGTVPTFQHAVGQGSYALVGRDPAQGGVTTITTLLVPIALAFEANKPAGKPFLMDGGWRIRPDGFCPVFVRMYAPQIRV